MTFLPLHRKLLAHLSTPRSIIALFMVVSFIYIIIYLMWVNPASQIAHGRFQTVRQKSGWISRTSSARSLLNSQKNGHSVSEVKGVWVRGRHIQIISAIHDLHHSSVTEKRFVLTTFLRHSSNRDFVCCFHSSLDVEDYIQIPAQLDYIDLRFIVDLQNAAFECVLPISEQKDLHFVSFAPEMCGQNMSLSIPVVYPVRRSWEFAVCTKVAYARLEPSRLVEWFEYMYEMGASKILTFYNNLHPESKRVFDLYTQTGYLDLIEYSPRSREGHPSVKYTERNSQTRQARHDKTLVVRDCQYRLAGYDFVLTIDFDELPVPLRPYRSLNCVLQSLQRNFSDGAAFRMDPLLLPPEWRNTMPDLYHWQFSSGTYIAPYCIKWVYIPSRTWMAATHEIIPKVGYHTYVIPEDVLHFLHFRTCKPDWRAIPCHSLTPTVTNETSLKRYASGVLRRMRRLPLEDLIPDKKYIHFVRQDAGAAGDSQHWAEDDLADGMVR